MDRTFLSIGPINIYWYSLLIVISIIIGMYFSLNEAQKNGLTKEFIYDLIFYLIPISIIGARTYYVIFNFSEFKNNLLDIFKIWEGGRAIYGAIISSIIFIIIYCKKKNKNTLLTLDTLVPDLILGQAIGRW
jgi:phosphatidylglycerol:prolipoprotein diacylglycerol transferase